MKYLGTLKKVGKSPMQVYAQHMQVDNISLRCHFCIYKDDCQNLGSLLICSRKHGCDNFSTMFAQLVEQQKNIIDDNDMFQPSAKTRSITIDYNKRFLRFIFSRYTNYNCYRNCYYYPEITSGDKSIFQCAADHGCGANSNWFTLLLLKDNIVNMFIRFATINNFYLLAKGIQIVADDDSSVVVFTCEDRAGISYNVIPFRTWNGDNYVLRGQSKDLLQWEATTLSAGKQYVSLDTNQTLMWYLYFNRYPWVVVFDWYPDKSYVYQMDVLTANKRSHEIYTTIDNYISETVLDGDETKVIEGLALCFSTLDSMTLFIVAKTGPYKNHLLMSQSNDPADAYWSEVPLPTNTHLGKNVTVIISNDTLQAVRWLVDKGCPEELLIF